MDPMTHLILHRQREREAIAAAEHRALIRLSRRTSRRDDRGTPAPPTAVPAPDSRERERVGAH